MQTAGALQMRVEARRRRATLGRAQSWSLNAIGAIGMAAACVCASASVQAADLLPGSSASPAAALASADRVRGCSWSLTVPNLRASVLRGYDPSRAGSPERYLAELPAPTREDLLKEGAYQIEEFRFIRDTATDAGYRVWLFGGTSTGFGDFLRGQLLRNLGAPKYQSERFDAPSFVNVYRSIQDFDIIIDGTPTQAAELEAALAHSYPHTRQGLSIWEVRLLRATHNYRLPLLGDGDFEKNHNDSQSMWAFELSTPAKGQHAVRDVRDWDRDWNARGAPSSFEDLWNGRLEYYFSAQHGESVRSKAGKNPPILSVIRALTKVFQYDFALSEADFAQLSAVVQELAQTNDLHLETTFDAKGPYALRWMKWAVKKLYKGAFDLERAVNDMDRMGLRETLLQIEGLAPAVQAHGAKWWISKEPLRTYPLGTQVANDPRRHLVRELRNGATAAELGLTQVTHRIDVQDYVQYEWLRWTRPGNPNVMMERTEIPGEHPGFTSGYPTLRTALPQNPQANALFVDAVFDVHPDAREGLDFFVRGNEAVFLNKAALRTRPESLRWNLPRYLARLAQEGPGAQPVDASYLARIILHTRNALGSVSDAELEPLLKHFETLIANGDFDDPFVREYQVLFKNKIGPELFITALRSGGMTEVMLERWVATVMSQSGWSRLPRAADAVREVIRGSRTPRRASLRLVAKYVLSQEEWAELPNGEGFALVKELAASGNARAQRALVKHVLPKPYWHTGHNLGPVLESIHKSGDAEALARLRQWSEFRYPVEGEAGPEK